MGKLIASLSISFLITYLIIILLFYSPKIFCFIKRQLNYILISANRARMDYIFATLKRKRKLRSYANYRIKEQNKLIRRKEIVIDTHYDPVFDSGGFILDDNDLDYLTKVLRRKGFTVVEDTTSKGQKYIIVSWNEAGLRIS